MTSMSTTSSATTSGKTPFAAIKDAEESAAKRIAEEKATLDEEFENARERNQRYEEDKRNEKAQQAREELKQAKDEMGSILAKHDAASAQECAALESRAKSKRADALAVLKKAFFSLSS